MQVDTKSTPVSIGQGLERLESPIYLDDDEVIDVDMFITRSCAQLVKDGIKACRACQNLFKNKTLEGILTRLEEGVNENLAFSYHSFSGLIEMLHQKNHQINFYRL